jgi:hypothetical protein
MAAASPPNPHCHGSESEHFLVSGRGTGLVFQLSEVSYSLYEEADKK